MAETYHEFFYRVMTRSVLPYQERYAARPFSSTLLVIPTGLGKTEAVLLPWLHAKSIDAVATPTRLIFVLPRQNLTAQTARRARALVEKAQLSDRVRVLELMAGSADNEERLRPDETAIIVATQDLYFSRALNRGYARRPPRWPIDFALYNQDCLIVLDEIQLMDDALATSRQLAAFRERFGTLGQAPCVWMSATVNPRWLQTVDASELPPQIGLTDEDLATGVVKERFAAAKTLAPAPPECRTPAGCAEFACSRHQPGTRTLIIVNTVPRAREILAAVRKKFTNAVLLHSRFRPADRQSAAKALDGAIPPEGQVVVSTQVLEAGVDITSRLLVTDVAPWGSLVQRFGRVNRYGTDKQAEIWWVDEPNYTKQKDPFAPYSAGEINRAVERLGKLNSASPRDLPLEDGPEPYKHVLRRVDLLDLFDTTPDLSGNELDISRFIRATEDKDVYLGWRTWPGVGSPPEESTDLDDQELCPVSIGEFTLFASKHPAYTLNFATEKWTLIQRSTPVYPGMIVVTHTSEGGYTSAEGWSPESKAPVTPVASDRLAETDTSDHKTFPKYRQTLRAHTARVGEKLQELLAKYEVDGQWAAALRTASLRHDWGKAHVIFQETLHRDDSSTDVLAKQCGFRKHGVPHFRHELGSALAMLQTGESDLSAYLAAAHHGRVRMTIRSMPGEREEGGRRVARGISDGDRLPEIELAEGVPAAGVELSLALMEFGAKGGSWTSRMTGLLQELGPFRLAFLETLLRTADEAASEDPGSERTACPTSN